MEKSTVFVLLAAYNGENYLGTMIDSLLEQDHRDLRIVLSDDGSTDASASILEAYAGRFPEKIIHYRSGMHFGCAQKHFMHLLSRFHDAQYIMFCDQDDVWHKDKVRKTLEKMKQVEHGENVPALVHTDLRVVDRELRQIAPSFWGHSNLDGSRLALNQLLVQNVVTGCTMMINRPLAELACRQVPENAMLMHDWWLALLASACGRTGVLNEATIDYRQHGSNAVGAKNVRSLSYISGRLRSGQTRQSLDDGARQAKAFADCYRDLLTADQTELLLAFAETPNLSVFSRDRTFLKYKLLKKGFTRVAAQLLSL